MFDVLLVFLAAYTRSFLGSYIIETVSPSLETLRMGRWPHPGGKGGALG
jgi:hypothetical protein